MALGSLFLSGTFGFGHSCLWGTRHGMTWQWSVSTRSLTAVEARIPGTNGRIQTVHSLFSVPHGFQPFEHPVLFFLWPQSGWGNPLRGKGLGDAGGREWESGRKGTVPISRLEGRLTVCVNSQTRQMNVPRTGKHILGRGWLLRQVCTLTEISSLRLTLENHPRIRRNPWDCAGVGSPGARSTRVNCGASHSCLLICWWGGVG